MAPYVLIEMSVPFRRSAAFRGEVDHLVEGGGNEIRKLHLRNRTESHKGCADCSTDNRGFRNGCVDDARFAKFFEKTGSYLECAAVNADVFTENEDIVVS